MTTLPFLEPKETAKKTSATVRNETVHVGLYGSSASPESERRHTAAYTDFDSLPDLETLAREQGSPLTANFDDLLGDFWPEGESVDDFLAARMRWRRQGRNTDS
jgi:hypothetical protein